MSAKARIPRARKALGQHFLIDGDVLAAIAEAARAPEGGIVVEIGAGTGQLTEALLDAGREVAAIEIEPRLLAHLRRRFAGRAGLRLFEGDARHFDFALAAPDGRPFSVAGNLPYFAAAPIVRHLLEDEPRPAEAVVMVQREVAREMAGRRRGLSLLGLAVRNRAEAETLFDVPPGAFDPPPRVHSSVVRLRPREAPLVPPAREAAFFALASGALRNPRKQLRNALARMPGGDAETAGAALAAAGIAADRRPGALAIDEWLALLDALPPAAPPQP